MGTYLSGPRSSVTIQQFVEIIGLLSQGRTYKRAFNLAGIESSSTARCQQLCAIGWHHLADGRVDVHRRLSRRKYGSPR